MNKEKKVLTTVYCSDYVVKQRVKEQLNQLGFEMVPISQVTGSAYVLPMFGVMCEKSNIKYIEGIQGVDLVAHRD